MSTGQTLKLFKNPASFNVVLHTMALSHDDDACIDQLATHHGIKMTAKDLDLIRQRRPSEVQRARDEIASQQEKKLISDLADNAEVAGNVVSLALKRTHQLLREGRVSDPSKVARDIADVQSKAIDKSRLLQDKPTQIVTKVGMPEIEEKLQRLGILVDPADADAEATAEEDPAVAELPRP